MSKCKKACQVLPMFAAEDIIDGWVVEGGLDLNKVKSEQQVGVSKKEVNYSFTTVDGFSVYARIYFAEEDGELRRFIWLECAIAQISPGATEVLEHLLSRNREVPAPLKLGLSDDVIVLCLRGPEDGFSAQYLKSLVDGIIPCATHLHREIYDKFSIPTLMATALLERQLRAH